MGERHKGPKRSSGRSIDNIPSTGKEGGKTSPQLEQQTRTSLSDTTALGRAPSFLRNKVALFAQGSTFPASVVVLDLTGKIVAVSGERQMLTLPHGAERADAICEGVNYLTLWGEKARSGNPAGAAFVAGLRAVLAGEVEEYSLEYPCHLPTEQRWLFSMAKRILFDSRPYAIICHLEVTKLKTGLALLAEELALTKALAEAANGMRDEFLATMSHELRTPLSIVLGYTDLLREGEFGRLTAQQVEILQRVRKNAYDMLTLISTLLEASSLRSGQASLATTEIPFGELLWQVRQETHELRVTSRLEFIWEIQDTEVMLHTDASKYKTVLRNLISNAVKFTEQGRVEVRGRRKNTGVLVEILDTGIGIAEEDVPRIFAPFYQLSGSTTRNKGGAGLGLYIAQRFVDLLGGTLTIESTVGGGSTFRVWIPSILR
ncbi:MAG: sensor histidine kinase [Candidatus Binatia bacterium]